MQKYFFSLIMSLLLFNSSFVVIKQVFAEGWNIIPDKIIQTMKKNYVKWEVLVKFKPQEVNLKQSAWVISAMSFKEVQNLDQKTEIKESNIILYTSNDETETVAEMITKLQQNDLVESVQPNFQYELRTNDTYFNNLWWLYHINDTDIDAPEAWDVNEWTNDDVIVAIIDSWVAYNHPDLDGNMWDWSSCVDNEWNALWGCTHWYDYEDSDKIPLPTSSDHWTHIAGTIWSEKDNTTWVVWVAPNVKIMAIKTSLTTADNVKSINFAKYNWAKVINASWGLWGSTCASVDDEALQTAIAGFDWLFIAAAGNDTKDHDLTNWFDMPADYWVTSACWTGLDNIISVAATDVTDSLSSFSDYGSGTVHVWAPWTNIYSTTDETVVSNEDFESITVPNLPVDYVKSGWSEWQTADWEGDWGNVLKTHLWNYWDNEDTSITLPVIDLWDSSITWANVSFWVACDTEYSSWSWTDYLDFQIYNWSSFVSKDKIDEYSLDVWNGESPMSDSGSAVYFYSKNITASELSSDFQIRYDWHSDESSSWFWWCAVDDIKVTKYTNGSDEKYIYMSGTSMAAPHVAWLAWLIWWYKSTLTTAEVKTAIIDTWDSLSSLNWKTITGKRINAYNAMESVSKTVSMAVSTSTSAENNFQIITFTVALSEAATGNETVNYTVTGTAILNSDYISYSSDYSIESNGIISFAVGETTKTIKLRITDDNIAEIDKTKIITLSSPVNIDLITTDSSTLTITDSDVDPDLVQYVWSGAVTDTTATVMVKTMSASSNVVIVVSSNIDLSTPVYTSSAQTADANLIIRFDWIIWLTANTQYYYGIKVDNTLEVTLNDSDNWSWTYTGKLKTFPTPNTAANFNFTSGTGHHGSNSASTHEIYTKTKEENGLFHILTGDFYYCDQSHHGEESNKNLTQDLVRENYLYPLTSQNQSNLYRSTPIAYVWDDHDFWRNDRVGIQELTAMPNAHNVYRQLVPHYDLNTENTRLEGDHAKDYPLPIYQTWTAGRVKFIMTDLYTDGDIDTATDDINKTRMWAMQKAWFKEELLKANGVYPSIIWISSFPWIGTETLGDNRWQSYTTERAELANFIKDNNIQGVSIISWDMHGSAIDNGITADYATDGGADIPIFQTGAYGRPGSYKGGPFNLWATNTAQYIYGLIEVTDDGNDLILNWKAKNTSGVQAAQLDDEWDGLIQHSFTNSNPVFTSLSPTDDNTWVTLDWDLVMTFSENIIKDSGDILIKLVSDNSTVTTISNYTVSTNELTIPYTWLSATTEYYVEIPKTAVKDSADNYFTGIYNPSDITYKKWNFTTITSTPTYTVTYNWNTSDGGSAPTDGNSYEEAESVTVLSNTFTKTGYIFDHWDTQADDGGINYSPSATFTMGTSNVILYAQWTMNQYAVTFAYGSNGTRSGGGETEQTINYDSDATAPIVTSNTGWTHSGWDKSLTNITETQTITATYSQNEYTLTVNNGTDTTGASPYNYIESVGISATIPTGYSFVNWTWDTVSSTTSAITTITMPDHNATVTANFANDNPTVSDIENQSTIINVTTSAIAFTIGDTETETGLLTPSGLSSNTTLIPNGNIVFGGSDANRTVTITPATDQIWSATITITITDEGGAIITDTFEITVTNKTAQTITFGELADKTYGDSTFELSASSDSWLTVSFASSDETVATISGTTVTIVGAGSTNITASQVWDATYAVASDVVQELVINVKVLTITWMSVTSNVYDKTNTATITWWSLVGVEGWETVIIENGTSGTFDSVIVGTWINVTHSVSLWWDDAWNYSLTSPTLTGDITVRDLTVSVTADNKVYDGNTTATVTLSSDKIVSDTVTLSNTSATFADAEVWTGKTVTVTGIAIAGDDAGNYSLSSTTANDTADITNSWGGWSWGGWGWSSINTTSPYKLSSSVSSKFEKLIRPINLSKQTEKWLSRKVEIKSLYHKYKVVLEQETIITDKDWKVFKWIITVPKSVARTSRPEIIKDFTLVKMVEVWDKDWGILKFSKDFELTIPVKFSKKLTESEIKKVKFFYYDEENKQWILTKNEWILSEDQTEFILKVDHMTKFAVLYDNQKIENFKSSAVTMKNKEEQSVIKNLKILFNDVSNHWAQSYITNLTNLWVFKNQIEFRPEAYLNRWELSKIVVEAFNLEINEEEKSIFIDIEDWKWYTKYIMAAVKSWVVKWYKDKTYKIDKNINRAEWLKMVLEAAGKTDLVKWKTKFTDIPLSAWFNKYVKFASENWIVNWRTSSKFSPSWNITRSEISKIISLVLELDK